MPASHPYLGRVETLVATCLSRIARQVIRRESFLAIAVALLGICLLLLLGTRYVPVALSLLTGCFGIWAAVNRWWTGIPDPYSVAQQIDHRQGLADRISTAYFFRSFPNRDAREHVVESQYELAARSAGEVDPEVVFPRRVPPTQRASVWLLCAALLLFGLRASVSARLSFEPPLATLLLGSLFGYAPEKGRFRFVQGRAD